MFSEKKLAAAIAKAQLANPDLSIPVLAVIIGVSHQTVYNWLKDRAVKGATEPKLSDAKRLAAVLGCRVSDFTA